MSRLSELSAKYGLEKAKYEPKPDCKFCRGTGERKVRRTGELTFCICLFVDHNASDDIGASLGQHAQRQLDALNQRRGT